VFLQNIFPSFSFVNDARRKKVEFCLKKEVKYSFAKKLIIEKVPYEDF